MKKQHPQGHWEGSERGAGLQSDFLREPWGRQHASLPTLVPTLMKNLGKTQLGTGSRPQALLWQQLNTTGHRLPCQLLLCVDTEDRLAVLPSVISTKTDILHRENTAHLVSFPLLLASAGTI